MSFFIEGNALFFLRENNLDVFQLDMNGWDDPGYAWIWGRVSRDEAISVRRRALQAQLGPPILDFSNSAITPSGLSKILRIIDDCGQLHVRNVAPRTLDLLALAGAFMMFHRKDVMHMVGERARDRIRFLQEDFFPQRSGWRFARAYRHKLLRGSVLIYEHDPRFMPRTTAPW